MRLWDITANSLRRRKGRLVLLIIGLTIGVATVVALSAITQALQADIANKLDEYGANMLIVPKSNDLSLSYGGVTVASAVYDVTELTVSDLDLIQTIENEENISVIAPKLLGAVSLGDRQVLMAGVRFQDEIAMKQWWEVTGAFPAAPDEVLVGARLAQTLQLQPGSTFPLGTEQVRVSGVLTENGSQDDHALFVDLGLAQRVLGKPDAISLVEVAALCTGCPIEELVRQIGEVLPQARVTALRQAVTLRMETVDQLTQFTLGVSAVVVAIGGLVVLTTMLGAVTERRQEIGLFRALGFRRKHIERIILSEAAVVSLLGGGLGWLLGMGLATVLAPHIMEITQGVPWNLWLALGAITGALVIGLMGSLYPARVAAKLDPTIALRSL